MNRSHRMRRTASAIAFALLIAKFATAAEPAAGKFQAGAAVVEITPTKFPVIVNGGFLEGRADRAVDALHVRALVLGDGTTRLAIAVVDSCGIEARFIDEAKRLASKATGIPSNKMLVSATHTHSAPSAWAALGSGVDSDYAELLVRQIARAIEQAASNVQPARVGWTVAKAPRHTHNRRWIYRPDAMLTDPFGQRSVRANMHPGYQNPQTVGPSGPVDADLSLLAIQTTEGKPLAVLANFSQHYFGSPAVSADYYGRFCRRFGELVRDRDAELPFVGIMSQGTSGDLMWMDYGQPNKRITIDEYSDALATIAHAAWKKIEYRERVPLAMVERKVKLGRQAPDAARLAWARPIAAAIKGRQPKTIKEVYAAEALLLHDEPEVEIKLQAIRIGTLSIAALPNEVFAITGLKLKAQSPLAHHFNISQANGAWGYIPPPEQHRLGGYTTWPARSAGLETEAEPKIVDALLAMLEDVASSPRKEFADPVSGYARAVMKSKPAAFWRLGDIELTKATDALKKHDAVYEGGVALYLSGPQGEELAPHGAENRSAHFAGGRVAASLDEFQGDYSVSCWFWNGLPTDARLVTGTLFTVGEKKSAETLFISGTRHAPGKLVFACGKKSFVGTTPLKLKHWHHVALVREKAKATVFLDGSIAAEIAAKVDALPACDKLSIAGTGSYSFEGKIDEFAFFARALTPSEIRGHYTSAGRK